MMDGQASRDGHITMKLGVVEKWVVSIGATLLTALVGMAWMRIEAQLERQAEAIAASATQQAVMSAQLTTMSGQLANVPALTERVTALEGDVRRNRQDIQEVRARQ